MKTTTTTYKEGGYDPAKPNNNISDQSTVISAGLSASRTTLPPDGTTPALLHYAGNEQTAVWRVNGLEASEPTTLQDGLRVSEIEVTAAQAGSIEVECNGSVITLEAT